MRLIGGTSFFSLLLVFFFRPSISIVIFFHCYSIANFFARFIIRCILCLTSLYKNEYYKMNNFLTHTNFSFFLCWLFKSNVFITLSPTWWKSDSRIILGVLAFSCPLYDVARTCKSWRWPRSSSLTFSTFRSRIWESFAKTGKCGNILINIIKEFLICT